MKINGSNNQKPTNPNECVIKLFKNEKGVFAENNVTSAKRMKQIPPIIEIAFLLIKYLFFIFLIIIK